MPVPSPPSPRTWSKTDIITVPRLRGDLSNLAQLRTYPPLIVAAQVNASQPFFGSTLTTAVLDTGYVDNFFGNQLGQATYSCQFPGWYLCEGDMLANTSTGAFTTGLITCGLRTVTANGGTTTDLLGNILCPNGVNNTGGGFSDLVQLDPVSPTNSPADTVALLIFQSVTGGGLSIAVIDARLRAEWVAMPTTLTDQIAGTVVSSPQPAALWPPGAGTQITNGGGIAAGATSMTVASNTGMVVNGTLGLDYYEGTAIVPTAETVNITSVSGTTIGISATTYPHGGTTTPGYVAVPVSAAWMNQQARDVINFLAYPPIVKLSAQGSTQTVPSQTFPAATAVSFGTAVSAAGVVVDNFGGWSNSNPTRYTFQVAGTYFVYGCVPFATTFASDVSAGIGISGGTIQWGDSIRSSAAQTSAATVRKVIRVTAGQYVELFGCLNVAGGPVGVNVASNSYAVLICVFRGF